MRKIALIVGAGVLLGAAATSAATWGDGSFAVHMLVHMGIVAVASPLIALGLSATWVDPGRILLPVTPLVASIVELGIVWFWHMPALRSAVTGSLFLTAVEQFSFLVGGLVLWSTCLRGLRARERLAGTAGLLFTSMHMTLLGVLLALSPRPLYGDGVVSCFGVPMTAQADQQVGGVVMLLIGAASYLIGGVALLSGLFRQDAPAWREGDRC